MANLKLAVRRLLKTPLVTAVAILSLALGIGANAAIYSLFNQVLLQPLPVPHPEELVNLSAPGPKPGSQSCGQAGGCEDVFSYAMFRDLERAQKSFTGVAAHVLFGANLAYKNQTLDGQGMLVSGSYFPTLQLQPALGRLLGPADDQTVGGHFVAVLSHSFWESRLGSDPGVVGQTIVINGRSMTIVGVAPKGFDGTTFGATPKVFVPLTMRGLMQPGFRGFENRQSYWAYLFARRKPGVTIDQARQTLNGIYKPIITDIEAPLQKGMSDQTMAKFKVKEVAVAEGRRGQSSIHREGRVPLLLLFSITGIVLLIACANIANLLLARSANRALEMAVRLSIGARRGQLLAQLLTESVLLAVLGGLASLVVARWTLTALASMLPPEASAAFHFGLSMPVVLFAAGLSIGTGILFGMFPALHSTRPDLISTLRGNTGQPSGARAAARFRTSLVTAQIALAMALLTSAGLFIKSLRNVGRVDLGLRVENVVTFGISPELNGYTDERTRTLFARVEEELAALPGVNGVTAGMVPLLGGSSWGNDVSVEGFKKGPDTDAEARFNEVGTDYFHTLGVTILSGREFTAADGLGSPKVAVVNEAFAKKFGLGRGAVGKHMSQGGEKLDIEVVGLVRNAKYSEVKAEVPPLFYVPSRQDSTIGRINFYVRTAGDPMQLLRLIPGVMAKLDPNLPVEELKTMP